MLKPWLRIMWSVFAAVALVEGIGYAKHHSGVAVALFVVAVLFGAMAVRSK